MRAHEQSFDIIRQSARHGEPDRYLAALLSPREARGDLITLAAFLSEIGRIGREVNDPMPGEIRLQWWRDALLSSPAQVTGSPIADAFAATIARRKLSHEAISDLLDANAHQLYPDPPADDAALMLSLKLTEGTAFKLAVQISGLPESGAHTVAIETAGIAYGLAKLGLNLPYNLMQRRMPVPPAWAPSAQTDAKDAWRPALARICAVARAHLSPVAAAFPSLPNALKSALLPIALVEPYLRALEREGHDAAHDVAELAPLLRAGRIGWAHVCGRV